MRPSYICFFFIFHILPSACRYIKDTNVKNSAEALNALINEVRPDTLTWTPKPGSVLDLGLALSDPTNRLMPQNSVYMAPINEQYSKQDSLPANVWFTRLFRSFLNIFESLIPTEIILHSDGSP